jgi:hypothetical protein
MNAKDAIKTSLTSTQNMVSWYLSDLSDADLLVRPVPNANHIAWQLGHLIESELTYPGKYVPPASYPSLPLGFGKQHDKNAAAKEPATGFLTKEEYLNLFNRARAATLEALEKIPEADLDKPTGVEWAPTVGAMFLMTSDHTLMHAGQFSVVRRKLGKPILF